MKVGYPAHGKEPLSPKLLPNALTVFETVARLESITAAASSLNVAASAVSRHIANLEARLSLTLFTRTGNRLNLTPDGLDLAEAVRDGLGLIQHRIADIRLKRSGTVIFGCSPDMALGWVMPRYDRIAARFDMKDFRMLTTTDYREFEEPTVDLSIRLGVPGDWPGFDAIPFLRRTAFPVCSPALLDAHPALATGSTEALMEAPLLHMGPFDQGVGTWCEWFGTETALPGPRFSYVHALIEAALGGHGVALATCNFFDDGLRDGRLVRLAPERVMPESYHVVLRQPERPAARLLATLLVD